MNAERFEAFLAKLYVDDQARARFVADPRGEARKAGVGEEDCAALEMMDFIGLEFAAESFAKKRAAQVPNPRRLSILRRLGFA